MNAALAIVVPHMIASLPPVLGADVERGLAVVLSRSEQVAPALQRPAMRDLDPLAVLLDRRELNAEPSG